MTKIILFTAMLLIATNAVLAQQTSSEKVYIGLSSGVYVKENNFTKVWEPNQSFNANIRVPFYRSQLEAGARHTFYRGNAPSETNSDFRSLFLHLGYLYPINISSSFNISPLLRFGGNLMMFEEPEIFTNPESGEDFITDTSEFEFTYGIGVLSQFQISNHWSVHATLTYNRTLTEIPLPVTRISAGISYSFDQPKWLKKILR